MTAPLHEIQLHSTPKSSCQICPAPHTPEKDIDLEVSSMDFVKHLRKNKSSLTLAPATDTWKILQMHRHESQRICFPLKRFFTNYFHTSLWSCEIITHLTMSYTHTNFGNISDANRANFNLGHQINIQGAWGDWVILQLTARLLSYFCKSPPHTPPTLPLKCWYGSPDWSLHNLHMICSLHKYANISVSHPHASFGKP